MYSKTGNNYKGAGKRVISMVLAIALICSFGLTSVFAKTNATIDSGVTDSGVGTITVSLTEETIAIGAKTGATAEITVRDSGSVQTVTWSSSNTAIAEVNSEGIVTGVAKGKANITATADADGKRASAAIEVTAAQPTAVGFTDLTANGADGTTTTELKITLDKVVAGLSADDITVTGAIKGTLTNDIASSYKLAISNITVGDGATVKVELAKTGFTFSPASRDVAINKVAPPVEPTYTIEVDQPAMFGKLVEGYTVPDAKTITVTNTGSETVTLTLDKTKAENFVVSALSDTSIPKGGKATLTIQPKAGLAVKDYDEYITISSAKGNTDRVDIRFEVTAKPLVPSVTSVEVTPKTASVEVAKTTKLTAEVVVVGGAAQTVTWTTSAPAIATVNSDGLVTAVAKGESIITATSTVNKSKSDTATITVTEKAVPAERRLRLNGMSAVIGFKQYQLTVQDITTPRDRKDVTHEIKSWSSSDTTIATVKDGKGGGLVTFSTTKLGTAIITAIAEDGTKVTGEVHIIPNLNYSKFHDTFDLATAYNQSTSYGNIAEIPKNRYCAPNGSYDILEAARNTAWKVYETPATLTQASLDAATATLNKVLNEFIANLKMGTLNQIDDANGNTVAITRAITAAWANYENTKNVSKSAAETYYKAVSAANSLEIYTQTAADKALADLNKATVAFNAAKTTGGGSSSGGSSSGGGTSTPSVDAPSSNVGGSGEVKSDDIKAETSKAVADAVKAAPGATANVTVKNADNITPAALKEMAAAATKAGGKVQLMADSVVNGVVETRLYINPALAGALKDSIKLGVSTNSLEIDATKAKFASFANNIAVASFAQQGSFGMKIAAAIKLDLTQLNTKTLVFYSYDKATNTYVPIVAPAYTIDKNGYLHFSTTVGGDIIITDKALVKK